MGNMSTKRDDVRQNEQDRVTNTVVKWLSEEEQSMNSETRRRSESCASCGTDEETIWLQLTIEWEEYLAERYDVERPDDICQVPLCTRCRAWAEMIEIAEMSISCQPESTKERIVRERNRFLESLSIELVQGIRVSQDLRTYATYPERA